MTLTTQGLLYVGSGKKLPRKEYVFNNRKQTVAFLNEQAFFDLLIQNDLVELFEGYCMRPGGDLYTFLYKECGLERRAGQAAILYPKWMLRTRWMRNTRSRISTASCAMRNSGLIYRAAA